MVFNGKRKDDRGEVNRLLENLKAELPALEAFLESCSGHWGYEDPIYRFYSGSFKVYNVQAQTLEIVAKLQSLSPSQPLNEWFMNIIQEGTGKTWTHEDNERWLEVTRPMLEAFFHARYFLEMAVKYARELEFPEVPLPSGWAALIGLYQSWGQ